MTFESRLPISFHLCLKKIRAQEVGLLAWDDTEFSFGRYHSREDLDERNIHNLLLYHKNRVVGLVITERRSYIEKFTWDEWANVAGGELSERSPMWSSWICLDSSKA